MDGTNGLFRNWGGYYESIMSSRGNLGLQLMPEKPLLDTRNAAFMAAANGAAFRHRDMGASQTMFSMDYGGDSWMNTGDKFFSALPGHRNYTMIPETSTSHHMQMVQPSELLKEERIDPVEEVVGSEMDNSLAHNQAPSRKRQVPKEPKSPKPKKAKRGPRVPKADSVPPVPRARSVKKVTEVMINGINMDISSIPIPVCSCTGNPQQCYRWGSGGWQSACCTTGLSVYPLPMSTKRRGARIAGRKMSLGAFKKVLEKLAAEGYNFSNPIDLKSHWAKHGTNKFVTIR